MLLKKLVFSLNASTVRRYAIIKNTVAQGKGRPEASTFEKFPPTEGNFDAADPISEGPDWSYVDPKRVTPLTPTQLKRQRHQRDLAVKVVQYLKEIKEAEDDLKEAQQLERRNREQTEKRRPKAKGAALAKHS